jgi:GT2 family glycosyltransferase
MTSRTDIIILNWNNYQMTAECIRSLLVMDAANYGILVVDNGSSDGSAEMLSKEFPQIIVLPQKSNLGFAAGCNVGVRCAVAKGAEYVLLLNNDTFVARDFLSEMLTAIETDPRIGAVCPKIYFAAQPDKLWYAGADFSLWTGTVRHRGWKEIDHGQFDGNHKITRATGCAMLVRCSALRDVGLLDEQFWAYAEDLDWSLRFLKRGYRLTYAPNGRLWHYDGVTSGKLMGSGSQAIRQFFGTRNMVFVARKHLRWWHVPTYLLTFMFNHIVFYTALRLWRRDFRALGALYRGVSQGLRSSLQMNDRGDTSTRFNLRSDKNHKADTGRAVDA